MCNEPSLLAKTRLRAVHFEVVTDGNQLRQVNALLFVLHIWLNESDRAQTALSMEMSTEMKIMVIMMVFGAVSDNGGVRNCSKNGKDNKNGGKTEWKGDKASKIVDKRWNMMMLFNGKSSNHSIRYLFNAFF